MTFSEFRNLVSEHKIFTLQDIKIIAPTFWEPNLVNWQKKGYITKITRGVYILSEALHNPTEQLMYIVAQKIYYPSYISLESALSHYNLIPEGVFTFTNITSRKTHTFNTPIGRFLYKHVKPDLMFGYIPFEGKKFAGYIAYPEKAILDYLYLHTDYKNAEDMHSLRINTDELFANFDENRYWQFAENFQNKQLIKRAKIFLEYWRNPTYAHY